MSDGTPVWRHTYSAPGELDYGSSPRATPLVQNGLVYTLGVHGQLHCLELESGFPLWQRNIAVDFTAPELTWGHSGSPLIADGRLIVQPGAPEASIVALNPETGEVIWQTPGRPTGYSSLIAGTFGGIRQVVGYDSDSLGGWSLSTGKRLWRLVPPVKGDFNVPTVVDVSSGDNTRIMVSTENNGTRIYEFKAEGVIKSEPISTNQDLMPDSHTPVRSGGRVFGIWNELYALDGETLQTVFSSSDDAFGGYGSLIASDSRLLCLSSFGELLLISTDTAQPQILSRLQLAESSTELLAHPAITGKALYARVGRQLVRLDLAN